MEEPREAAPGGVDGVAAVATALAEVEAKIEDRALDEAVALLCDAARALATKVEEPRLLARAAWLAASVALLEGDQAGFRALSGDAVAALGLGDAGAETARLLAARNEILAQLDAARQVREHGTSGLMEVLQRLCQRLLDLAETGTWAASDWQVVDHERALLPALLRTVESATGAPAPLAEVIRALSLDPIDSVLLSTLAPLSREPPRSAAAVVRGRDELARLCFRDESVRADARARLRSDGTLARTGALIEREDGALTLDPVLVDYLYGGDRGPRLPGARFSIIDDPPPPIPRSHIATTTALARSLSEHRVTALVGRRGAGRPYLLRAASGGPVLEVTLEDASDPDQREPALVAAARLARYRGATLYLTDAAAVSEAALRRLEADRIPVAIAIDVDDSGDLDRLHRACASPAMTTIAPVSLTEQASSWADLLGFYRIEAPSIAVLASSLCHHGLGLGEMVRACKAMAHDPPSAPLPALREQLASAAREELTNLGVALAVVAGGAEDRVLSSLIARARQGAVWINPRDMTTERKAIAPLAIGLVGAPGWRAATAAKLAAALDLACYRVDAAAASRALAAAARCNATLLFEGVMASRSSASAKRAWDQALAARAFPILVGFDSDPPPPTAATAGLDAIVAAHPKEPA